MNVIGEETPVYQPVFEITKQKGAVYSITAAEDIVTPDGTVRVKKGTVVDTVTTGGNGTATSKALYLGKYTVKEDKMMFPLFYHLLMVTQMHCIKR